MRNLYQAELLTHPNIPKPLHGVNPRTLLGQEWWERKRQEAYATYDFHCWACGIHKSHAKYHRWLEAHESYDIDYARGRVELRDIVALCHSCHNFIHSGRMWELYKQKQLTKEKMLNILQHGFHVLKQNNLKPFYGTACLWLILQGYSPQHANEIVKKKGFVPSYPHIAKWDEWHLILEGKRYYSRFEDMEEWKIYYKSRAHIS